MRVLRQLVIGSAIGALAGFALVFAMEAEALVPRVLDQMVLAGGPVSMLRKLNTGALKVWNTGEVLKASDLNGNFSTIDANYVGNKGGRLVDADVSTIAAISHIKLAVPGVLPKAVAGVLGVCAAGTCSISFQQGVNTSGQSASQIASVTHSGAGIYTVALLTSRADTTYGVLCNVIGSSPGGFCTPSTFLAGSFVINTQNAAGAATDEAFFFALYDDEN